MLQGTLSTSVECQSPGSGGKTSLRVAVSWLQAQMPKDGGGVSPPKAGWDQAAANNVSPPSRLLCPLYGCEGSSPSSSWGCR